MAIAFSDLPITFASIDGTSSAALRAALHTNLTAVGWVGTSITGGYEYLITSPQSPVAGQLDAKVRIQDLGTTSGGLACVTIQIRSSDGLRLGHAHLIACGTGRTYELIAGICQMFLYLPGVSSTNPPDGQTQHAVCLGVPHVPKDLVGECAVERVTHVVTEAWWSSGTPSSSQHTFRTSWAHTGSWSACYNGDQMATASSAYGRTNRLALRPISHADSDYSLAQSAQETQWHDDSELYFDPLLVWGTAGEPSSGIGRVRGQMWDAMLGSKDAALEAEIETVEVDPDTLAERECVWRNYMHYQGSMAFGGPGSYFSSLYLLKETTDVVGDIESNYAY